MFEKMLGVSPPPKAETPNSKPELSKDLRGTSKSDYKKDFEKALQIKLDRKKEDLEHRKEVAQKNAKAREEELRADKKDKKDSKSLGGTKKKVTSNDDKMISNLMASNESKVEIPDSKIEDLAEIEVDITQKLNKNESLQTAGMMNSVATDAKANAEAVSAADAQAQQQQQMQSLEAELGAAVDFKADSQLQQSSKDLAQKMKAFDATEKNPVSEKAQAFEQNVLQRLQKDMGSVSQQFSESNQSGSEQKNSDSQSRDLKSDLLNGQSNQLHQAAGQSHGDFKAHLNTTSGAESLSTMTTQDKLEANRDANINEIMNRAQYLVKHGGGEMSVKMTPEGLGEVHLRVLLQDGKLSIEMQTHDKDVKKLIEESLSDLKSGLAAHRLSLEHVKIDTVNATNADNNTQFQSNLNQGGSQDRSREFWNGFQDNMNNQSGSRSSQREASNVSTLSPRVATTAAASNAASGLRTYGGTKGATVNRVA